MSNFVILLLIASSIKFLYIVNSKTKLIYNFKNDNSRLYDFIDHDVEYDLTKQTEDRSIVLKMQ